VFDDDELVAWGLRWIVWNGGRSCRAGWAMPLRSPGSVPYAAADGMMGLA